MPAALWFLVQLPCLKNPVICWEKKCTNWAWRNFGWTFTSSLDGVKDLLMVHSQLKSSASLSGRAGRWGWKTQLHREMTSFLRFIRLSCTIKLRFNVQWKPYVVFLSCRQTNADTSYRRRIFIMSEAELHFPSLSASISVHIPGFCLDLISIMT